MPIIKKYHSLSSKIQGFGEIRKKHFYKDLWEEIFADEIFDSAATLAYYWMLALFPAMIFLLSFFYNLG